MSQRHEDYLVMSQISRNSFEEEPNHHVPKNKKVKQNRLKNQKKLNLKMLKNVVLRNDMVIYVGISKQKKKNTKIV